MTYVLYNLYFLGAKFINIGRSNVISESDLIKALDKGWLSAAILDVFDTEPLPVDHPFWSHEKITVTPHVAGISRPQDISKCFQENYRLFTEGKELNNVINWEECY